MPSVKKEFLTTATTGETCDAPGPGFTVFSDIFEITPRTLP